MVEETNFRELLQEIESVLYDPEAADAAAFAQTLQRAKPAFLNLLRYKEPNAESRAAVQSCKPVTPVGTVVLDPEPDVREILLLSDELRLDEILALMCVQSALAETGEVSAAAGAGIYFEERRGLLTSLWLLLQAQVMLADSLPSELYEAVCAFNADLLSAAAGGRTVLVQRLAELIRSNPLEAGPGSRLPVVIDGHGREVERNALVQREQTVLCECLVYACCIRQRLPAADVSDLAELLHHQGLKARAAAGDLAAQQQAYLVLVAALLPLLPLESAEGQEAEADERQLRDLASHKDLDHKIGGGPADDPHCAVLKLAWAVLLSLCGPESAADRAATLVKAATDAGALGFLKTGVLDSAPMQDEADHQRQLYASIVNQLLMAFLSSPAGSDHIAALKDLSLRQGRDEVAESAQPSGQGFAGTLMAVDAAQQTAPQSQPDSLATLLSLIAAVYGMHPDLFLDDELRVGVYGDVLGQFMEMVAASEAMSESPSAFVAYLAVLTALSAGEKGARSMYTQLRGDRFSMISWRKMFQLLVAVVRQYMPEDSKDGVNGGAANGASAMQQRPLSDYVLPACDSRALCAYLGLFSRVMSEGRLDEALSWIRQLEEDAGLAPVWEVFFQAMCSPVPQELKAALDEAIASLARRADVTAALWERLVAAVVVAPASVDAAAAAVLRYDLTYQLNEIEARAEDYTEALAFVRLLNALWRCPSGVDAQDEGRGVAHFTKFVREELLGTAFQRAYRDERQRWQLVAACLEHCRLCLTGLRNVAALGNDAASNHAAKPPGLDVLLDMLGERHALRAAMTTLLAEVDRLAYERHAMPYGASKEAAVLSALHLLRSALDRDAELVAALRRATHSASYETLDVVLRHDRRRLPLLLDYVRYPHNPAVQAEAARIAAHLAERIPTLVPLLLNSPPTGSVPAVQRLQDGYAACLQSSLFNLAASVALEDGEGEEGPADGGATSEEQGGPSGGDPRAAVVLRLLLVALEQPAPNLAHLLCGYDFDAGSGHAFLPDQRSQYNVLRVLLSAVQTPSLASRKPALFEQCLEVLYELAASLVTGPATLEYLRAYYATLVPLLDWVGLAPLPEDPQQRASSLHQRAWLLQLYALELHRADPALPQHAESLTTLLTALFSGEGPQPGAAGNGATPPSTPPPPSSPGQGRSRMLDLLGLATSATPDEPQLGREAHPEARRIIQALELDTLLASGAQVAAGGVRAVSPRGIALYDVVALKDELLKRYNEWVARHGAPSEALREACRAALQYAQQYNAYAELAAGQAAVLGGWQAALLVAVTRRFEALAAAAGAATLVELVVQLAEECLRALAQLLTTTAGLGLAPALCEAVQALLARLQEQVAAAAADDPLAGLPLPARCHGLLRLLLEAAQKGRSVDAARLPLYSALTSYLTMCRGPSVLRAPPPVVEALLAGLPVGGSAAQQLDALQSQLEEGNTSLLLDATPLLELLAADSLSADPASAAAALTALCAVLAADQSGGAADVLYAATLPSRLLADLAESPYRALTQPPSRGQAALLVAEAQLTLLLRLALAGPPNARPAAAQRLFALQALPRLGQCKALDLQPEEPGFGLGSGAASLRSRLHHLVTPLLRLVLAIVTALPDSAAVRDQALAFVEEHAGALTRVMHDAASPGIRGWEPGNAELEEATLAVQLLAELAPYRQQLPSTPQLQEAAYRLAGRFLCLSSKSPSPAVARLAAAREAGRRSAQETRTYLRVLALRCALSHYLLQLCSDPRHPELFRCSASNGAGGGGGLDLSGRLPTLFLIKDGLLQAAMDDLPEALAEAPALLEALRSSNDGTSAAARTAEFALAAVGDGGGAAGREGGRARLARAAATVSTQLSKLLYLTEHLLAILYTHLRLCLPAPALGGGGAGADGGLLALTANCGGAPGGARSIKTLGSERDLDQLRRLMEPVISALERTAPRTGRDTASLELLVRRTKEYLSVL